MSDDPITKLSKQVETGFKQINQRLDSHEKTFAKMFQYMEKRFDAVDDHFEAVDTRFDKLTSTIDAFLKRLDDYELEQAARDRQFERLLDWARKVSKKTGIPLENL